MRHSRMMTAAVAALLLAAALAAHAQSRRDRWNREDRGDRSGRGDRETERGSAGTQPSGAATSPSSDGRTGRMEDEYGILLRRSIFARSGISRGSEQPSTRSTQPSAPVLTPEQAIVFRGVLAQGDEFVAFAENQTTQQLMILRNGDDVANGKVVVITLDTIAYGSGGSIKEVHVGQNLAGDIVASASGSYTPSTGPSSPGTSSGSASPPPSAEQAAIIERLKRARQSGQ